MNHIVHLTDRRLCFGCSSGSHCDHSLRPDGRRALRQRRLPRRCGVAAHPCPLGTRGVGPRGGRGAAGRGHGGGRPGRHGRPALGRGGRRGGGRRADLVLCRPRRGADAGGRPGVRAGVHRAPGRRGDRGRGAPRAPRVPRRRRVPGGHGTGELGRDRPRPARVPARGPRAPARHRRRPGLRPVLPLPPVRGRLGRAVAQRRGPHHRGPGRDRRGGLAGRPGLAIGQPLAAGRGDRLRGARCGGERLLRGRHPGRAVRHRRGADLAVPGDHGPAGPGRAAGADAATAGGRACCSRWPASRWSASEQAPRAWGSRCLGGAGAWGARAWGARAWGSPVPGADSCCRTLTADRPAARTPGKGNERCWRLSRRRSLYSLPRGCPPIPSSGPCTAGRGTWSPRRPRSAG